MLDSVPVDIALHGGWQLLRGQYITQPSYATVYVHFDTFDFFSVLLRVFLRLLALFRRSLSISQESSLVVSTLALVQLYNTLAVAYTIRLRPYRQLLMGTVRSR